MKQLEHFVRSAILSPPSPPRPRPTPFQTGKVQTGTASRNDLSSRPPPFAAAGVEGGIYPCPFGFALNVPLHGRERLVPVTALSPALLAPVADALALVRESGGFETLAVHLPTAEIRLLFERLPDLARATRRIKLLARELLAVGMDAVPGPRLDFEAALELRMPTAHSLSVHLYVDGTSSSHERLLSRLAGGMLPALSRLAEANAHPESCFVLRRRVLARCRVDLARLFARLPGNATSDLVCESDAVQHALRWLDGAQEDPVLASAQNELVLSNVARVAHALGNDAQRITAEGHCHAARFGAVAPLARFARDGAQLTGELELPLELDPRERRCDRDADLANDLVSGDSIEDIGLLSSCLGLAAHLATVQSAISLALMGLSSARTSSRPPPVELERTSALPVPVDWEARRSSLPQPRRSREASGIHPTSHARSTRNGARVSAKTHRGRST